MRSCCAFLPLLLLTACAVQNPGVATGSQSSKTIAWPAAPAPARIRYLNSFSQPADLGYRVSISSRLRDIFGGAKDRSMVRPYAIAVNGEHLAIADPGLSAVHLFNTSNKSYELLTSVDRYALSSPVGIALGDRRLYVADSAQSLVFVLDDKQRLVKTIGEIERPTGLAFEPAHRRLFVADTNAHRVLIFNQDGEFISEFGERGGAEGQFNYPTHLFVAAQRLYVNDTLNFRVQVFDLDGQYLSSFGEHGDSPGYFAQPKGLVVNDESHIFVAEAIRNQVQIFSQTGEFLLGFGSPGKEAGAFFMPAGLAIWQGRIYVADSGNGRIQVFEYLGEN